MDRKDNDWEDNSYKKLLDLINEKGQTPEQVAEFVRWIDLSQAKIELGFEFDSYIRNECIEKEVEIEKQKTKRLIISWCAIVLIVLLVFLICMISLFLSFDKANWIEEIAVIIVGAVSAVTGGAVVKIFDWLKPQWKQKKIGRADNAEE